MCTVEEFMGAAIQEFSGMLIPGFKKDLLEDMEDLWVAAGFYREDFPRIESTKEENENEIATPFEKMFPKRTMDIIDDTERMAEPPTESLVELAGGSHRSFSLPSGVTITIATSVDVLSLDREERDFILKLTDEIGTYSVKGEA